MGSTAIADLAQAQRFGTNLLIVEDDTDGDWDKLLHRLALYESSPCYRPVGDERARVERLRAHYRDITEVAQQRGVLSYIMCPEVSLPPGFDPVSLDNPHLWALLGDRLREVLRALPCLDGFMLYLEEARYSVAELPGSELSLAKRYARLIETAWQACQAERRKLLVATFIHRPERLAAVAAALRGIPPHRDLSVVQYCCPNDWGLYELANPAIGQVGPHPEILAFDYAGENWGQGAHPFIQVDFMARRLRESLACGARVAGLAGYVAWYGRSALGTLNEANIAAAAALAADFSRDAREILHAWCEERFGAPAAGVAALTLARTFEAVFKVQHVFGYWLDTGEKSGLPSLRELENYLVEDRYGEALCKWDARRCPTWEKILAPDRTFLRDVLREKDEAIDLCRQSLAELRGAGDLFRHGDRQALERAFLFQELWARVWRELVRAFILHRISIVRGEAAALGADLDEALRALEQAAAALEDHFGADVFPRGPARARAFIRDIRAELH